MNFEEQMALLDLQLEGLRDGESALRQFQYNSRGIEDDR